MQADRRCRARWGGVLALIALLLAACSSAGAGVEPATSPIATAAAGAADPPRDRPAFTNPVVPQDFPDPSLLEVDGTFYLYGTERRGTNLQLQTSTDLVHWTDQPDPLPVLGGWADRRKTWAPEVTRVGDTFVLFYTAADRASVRLVRPLGLAR